MTETTTIKTIYSDELSLLLHDLENFRKDICIRVYVKGALMTRHFSNVLVLTPHAIILNHMPTRSIKHIRSIGDILSFEIDKPWKGLTAFTRYAVPTFENVKIKREGLYDA